MPTRRRLLVALAMVAAVAATIGRIVLLQELAHRPVPSKARCEAALVAQVRAEVDNGTTQPDDPTPSACAGLDDLTTMALRAQALKTLSDELLAGFPTPPPTPSPSRG